MREDARFEVEVIDHGIGIGPEDQQRIFDEFVQIGKSAQQQEGTGLGLPISKRLAELLHGELLVHSTPGEGSRFQLILPTGPEPRTSGEEHARHSEPTVTVG